MTFLPLLATLVAANAPGAQLGTNRLKSFTVPLESAAPPGQSAKSFQTGKYRNLFREIGKTDTQIVQKLETAWNQLFYGNDSSQRVYYPVGKDMAYIKDVGNNDVRSEGMSYGMMIAVQYNKKAEFDRLWKWSKTYMQHQSGPWKGYFAWQCRPDGTQIGKTPASDGEEYFVMALFFAHARWGTGRGIYNYRAEADQILDQMVNKETINGGVVDGATNMFNHTEKQVVFVPFGTAATFTDASYHLPAFYELWSRWAAKDKQFWADCAQSSRAYFKRHCHPTTGLASDYSSFQGVPMGAPWDPNSTALNFQHDAFRVAGNIAMDYQWFGTDSWQVSQNNRLLEFFNAQKPDYVSLYTVDGQPKANYKSGGLIAMNAASGIGTTTPVTQRFVNELWNMPVPSGQWRYYDGMLYMFGLLHASGQYKIWHIKK